MLVTGSTPFPFITKEGSLGSFKTISTSQFNNDFAYGDVVTGSYPLSSSISSDFYTSGLLFDGERKRKLLSLKNTLNYYKYLSPHYAFSSNYGDKELQELRLVSIPSIFYGQSIKKGTVSCKWYLSGSLMAELADVRQNGELVQVYPSGSGFREIQKLTASFGTDGLPEVSPEGDLFGWSVAFSATGETLAVGARSDEENGGTNAGAAYIFKKNIDGYQQVQKLTASFGTDGLPEVSPQGDYFGQSIALSPTGETLAAGAWYDEENGGGFAGAVYIFTSGSSGYQQSQKLTASNVLNPQNDRFGYDKSVYFSSSGKKLIIGAPGVQNGLGRVYVFESASAGFQQGQQIMASGPGVDEIDFFGTPVVLSQDEEILTVGAFQDDDGEGNRPGSIYVFQSGSSGYQQVQKLTASKETNPEVSPIGDRFGNAIAISSTNKFIAIGAYRDGEGGGDNAGAVYIFESGSDGYQQVQKLTATRDNDPAGDYFGWSVAFSSTDDTLFIGAYADEENGINNAGSVYVYKHNGSGFRQTEKLFSKQNIYPSSDYLGLSLSYSPNSNTLAVGGADVVYIFYENSGYNKVAGSVLYNEGFILLTGSWSLHPTYTDKFNVNDTLVDYSPSWYYFMTTGSEGTNQVPSSSFSLNFEGIEKIPTLTMLAKAEVGEFNHSNNPTFIEYGQDASLVSSSNSLSEKSDLAIKNIVPSIYDEEDPPLEKITYISKVAIYDKEKNLIGVAKLANPVRKRQNDSLSLKLKLDL